MPDRATATDWMPGVEVVESAARWRGANDVVSVPRLGVIHHVMQGYQGTMDAWARERPMRTPKSAHFTLGRDGTIHQHVRVFDHAWTAGRVCKPSWPLLPPQTNPNRVVINIEWEGFSVPPTGYDYDYLYGIEGRADRNGRPMHPWPDAQVQAAIAVHQWLFATGIVAGQPSPATITGHYATDACSRADDPGLHWIRTVQPDLIRAGAPGAAVLDGAVAGLLHRIQELEAWRDAIIAAATSP